MIFATDEIIKIWLTPNPYSRPKKSMEVRGIALHWVENPGQKAWAVRNYFENRKYGERGYGSTHFIIDDQDVIQCIPLDEIGYHVGASHYTPFALKHFGPYPNKYLIGIEMCHPDWTGEYTPATMHKTELLCRDLCIKFAINPIEKIVTHHAITGKETFAGACPKWFTEHPDELDDFRLRVKAHMQRELEDETFHHHDG